MMTWQREAEARRAELSYCRQLAAAVVLDPGPVEAVEEDMIARLRESGAAGVRQYAVGQELTVLLNGVWRDVGVVREADGAGRCE